MNTYYAGQSVRLTGTGAILGSPVTPGALSLVITGPKPGPGGVTMRLTASIIVDATGFWHADFVLPLTAPPGLWSYQFTATGSDPSSSSVSPPSYFVVQAPSV